MPYILFLLLSLGVVLNVQAQVYKWVDQDGNTQYTDQPPPSTSGNEKELNIKTPPPAVKNSENVSDTETLDEKMQAFKERRSSKQEAEKELQAKAIENNKRCVSAQGQLKIFRESPRLTFPDGKGGIVYADDEMRRKKIAEAQNNIKTFCK